MVAAAPTPAVGCCFVFVFVRAFVVFVAVVVLVFIVINSSEEDEDDVISCIIVPVVRFDSMDLHLPIYYAAAAVFNFRSSSFGVGVFVEPTWSILQ